MELTIKSRVLDRTLTFSRAGNYYIYVDLNGEPGMLGKQICRYGGLLGQTIGYSGDDQDRFNKICRNWYRNYIRKIAEV